MSTRGYRWKHPNRTTTSSSKWKQRSTAYGVCMYIHDMYVHVYRYLPPATHSKSKHEASKPHSIKTLWKGKERCYSLERIPIISTTHWDHRLSRLLCDVSMREMKIISSSRRCPVSVHRDPFRSFNLWQLTQRHAWFNFIRHDIIRAIRLFQACLFVSRPRQFDIMVLWHPVSADNLIPFHQGNYWYWW